MATIVLRTIIGRPLTIAEADANFNNLNTEVGTKLTASEFNASNILNLLSEYDTDGDGQGLNAATILSKEISSTNTADTIALRTSNGHLNAIQFNGNFVGPLTGDVIGNLTGTVTGNATNVDGVVAIEHGGTGATTVPAARTALGLGNMALQNSNAVNITGGTITGISALAIPQGGTGAINATQARTNLGLVLGSDVQPFSNELTAIAGSSTTGIYVRTGSGSVAQRTLTTGGNGIVITDGDGVAGNPTISLSSSSAIAIQSLAVQGLTVPSIVKSGASGSGDIGQTDNRFGTIYGTATSAKYADLAEKYTTDQTYEPGTVVVVSIAGESEATASFEYGQRVLGVVSTNPAHVMNDTIDGQAIGLVGRLPVKVIGPIKKGQTIVANPDGKAIAGANGYVFGQALETNLDHGVKLVECFIK